MEALSNPEIWMALATLTALEHSQASDSIKPWDYTLATVRKWIGKWHGGSLRLARFAGFVEVRLRICEMVSKILCKVRSRPYWSAAFSTNRCSSLRPREAQGTERG